MKEQLQMLAALFQDCSAKCSTVSWSHDIRTIKERVAAEGVSFLTLTLPSFSESFFKALERGQVTSDLFIGWKKRLCLPAFMQGFTALVFDQRTGGLLDEPLVEAIQSIRQICNWYKKVAISCTPKRNSAALEKYMQTDRDLGSLPILSSEDDLRAFEEVSRIVISSVFGEEVDEESLLPHHGPGSTAEKIRNNGKYCWWNFCWYDQLDGYFDQTMLFSSEVRYHTECAEMAISELESTVRVISVPKTLKAPRIIAMEPVVMQMAQQSLKDYMVERIERLPLTSGHVNFTDQRINQRHALVSSVTRRAATLDMSDASDRIHKELVWRMFSVNPRLRDLIFSCRSPYADVDGKRIMLNKFASMGSALCFPVMSLYFYVLLIKAWHDKRALQPTINTIRRAARGIYVYGDDIVIPVDEVDSSVSTLTKFGNVVGLGKSFWQGSFRESCGVDAYAGKDITPVYQRQLFPEKWRDASRIISAVMTANLFWEKGFCRTALVLKKHVEDVVGSLPQLRKDAEGLGWWFDDTGDIPVVRYNHKLQRLEVRTIVPQTILEKDELRDYNALFKCLLTFELRDRKLKSHSAMGYKLLVCTKDHDHLDQSTVRGALTLKRRWVAIH